jgi:branched-chain amino acid transport system permease protein
MSFSTKSLTRPVRRATGRVTAPLGQGRDWVGQWWRHLSTPGRWVVYGLTIIGALLLPYSEALGDFMTPGSDWASVLFYPIGIYILLALGLNMVVGYAGLLDLGFVAFFAIGAYSMAILSTEYGWGFWEVLPVALLGSMLAGLLLGLPSLRVRGDYLAIVTLGFGEIIRISANNLEFTGGPRGISSIPHPPDIGEIEIFQYGIVDPKPYYFLLVVIIVLVIIAMKRLEGSRVGRSWAAIREDEDAAELMGVPTLKFKLWAFALGASVGGTAGCVYASKIIAIAPPAFPFLLSAFLVAAVVLGGAGNIPGVILGAFLVAWLPERFRTFAEYRGIVFGAALVILMAVRPEGLLPSRQRRAELAEGAGGAFGAETGALAAQAGQVEEDEAMREASEAEVREDAARDADDDTATGDDRGERR